jgi:hypothetical protein
MVPAWIGRGFRVFKELKKNMDVVDISEGVSWVAGEKQEPDPFVWTSPKSFSCFASNVRLDFVQNTVLKNRELYI